MVKKRRRQTFFFIVNIIFLVSLLFFCEKISFKPLNISVTNRQDGQIITKNYRWIRFSQNEKHLSITSEYFVRKYSTKYIKLTPIGCINRIKINNKIFQNNQKLNYCDKVNGHNLYIGDLLKLGKNRIEIELNYQERTEKIIGLSFNNSFFDFRFKIINLLTLVSIFTLSLFLGQLFYKDKIIPIIISFGLSLRLIYLNYTQFYIRSHDVDGHLFFSQFISLYNNIPPINACWECHQQPLYYYLSSYLIKISKIVNIDYFNLLQQFSLLLSIGTIIFSFKIISEINLKKVSKYITFIALVVWPAGIIHSIRISNDGLFYFLFTTCLYCLLVWWKKSTNNHLTVVLLILFFLLLTKSNGIILGFVLIVCFIAKLCHHNSGLSLSKLSRRNKLMSIVLSYSLLNVSSNEKLNALQNAYLTIKSQYGVQNSFNRFFTMDFASFLNQPFINVEIKNNFWSLVLKTSLFGEFSFNKPSEIIAILISFNYLLIIIQFIIGTIFLIRNKHIFPLIITLFFSLLIQIFYAYKLPIWPTADFRYILPIIILIFSFPLASINNISHKLYKRIAIANYLMFIILCISFLLINFHY